MLSKTPTCATLLITVATAAPGSADVTTLSASKDNTLYSEDGELSNGAGDHFFAGATDGPDLRRAVIAFDVASAIPAGSTVTAVSLKLRMSRTKASTEPVGLYLALRDWGEGSSHAPDEEGKGEQATTGDATWTYRFYSSSSWSPAGGEFAATASATTPVGSNGDYFWSSAGLVADVQAWVDNPGTNFGWFIRGNESGTKTTKRFDSRQNSNVSRRPQLTVTFDPPATTGACCHPDGSCTITTSGDCSTQGGTYQGNGVPCTPSPCPQPTGACCFADGTCTEETLADCQAQGGTWQGAGTDCTPNPCPQPTGACCFSDGTCTELTLAECTSQAGTWQGPSTSCTPNPCPVSLTPFVDPLPIPAVAVPTSGTAGFTASYDIAITEFQQQLHRDLPPTVVWGYAGSYPGPTIEARSNHRVTVTWRNDLRDLATGQLRTSHYLPVDLCMHGPNMAGNTPRTVVHLHGGHVEAAYDGYPEHTMLPGGSQVYLYDNRQLPGTLWCHDHALGITRLNVYMGLAGFYLVRDDFEDGLGLPSGEFEIEMAIQDRSFNPDGSLKYPAQWQEHFFGDSMLVNGKVWPFLNVKKGKYRFRLLNGCNSRTLSLALSNAASFQVVGTEGGLLPTPVTVGQLTMAPGERYDVIMDFEPYSNGTEIDLVNSAPAPYPGSPGVGVIPDVMRFVVSGASGHVAAIPSTLRPLTVLEESNADVFRSFELQKSSDPCAGSIWTINGLGWDDITEFPYLGDTEVWSFVNRSGIAHPMHMHLVFFQVLDRQDFTIVSGQIVPTGSPIPPPAHEMGWKDTVQVYPNQITRVIARFTDYEGLYAYHCHILEHEDHEMMRQFKTIRRFNKTGRRTVVIGPPEDFDR